MQDSLNSHVGIVVQYFLTITGVLSTLRLLKRKVIANLNSFHKAGIIALITLLGVIFPLATLLFSNWTGWVHILLNFIAIYSLLNFIGLLYIINGANKILSEQNDTIEPITSYEITSDKVIIDPLQKNKMQTCRLCLKEKPLVKSHIIPDFYYNISGMYNEKHQILFSSFQEIAAGKKPSKQFSGEYDNNILCSDCDGRIIGSYETYAAKTFSGEAGTEMANFILADNTKCRRYYNIDYRNYKLFLLSILWRMSISSRPIFRDVNLGDWHNEKLREMIYAGDPKEINTYPILSSHYFNDEAITDSLIISPIQYGGNISPKVLSILPGYIHIFIISSDANYPLSELKEQVINKQSEVTFMELETGMTMRLIKSIAI